MKITLLYQVSHYIRVKKQRNIKSWDQQNYLVIRGFCYIRPRYNEVPLYFQTFFQLLKAQMLLRIQLDLGYPATSYLAILQWILSIFHSFPL